MATPNDSWPNRKLAATVVDSDPPEHSARPSWNPPEETWGSRPTSKRPQRRTRRTSDQMDATAAPRTRPVGRWIVAGALWGFVGALLVGPPLANLVYRGVGVGMNWLTPRAPGFLRPYLPRPIPPVTPLGEHVKTARVPEAWPRRELLPIQVLPPPQSHKRGGRTH